MHRQAEPAASTPAQQHDDEVTANLPLAQAPLASVALARINVALHQATKRAREQLCAGSWTPAGTLHLQHGPRLEHKGAATAGDWHWSYRSLRQPDAAACQGVSRELLFQEISRHLPDWISTRPAGRDIAYRRGQGVLPGAASRVAANQSRPSPPRDL